MTRTTTPIRVTGTIDPASVAREHDGGLSASPHPLDPMPVIDADRRPVGWVDSIHKRPDGTMEIGVHLTDAAVAALVSPPKLAATIAARLSTPPRTRLRREAVIAPGAGIL